MENLYDLFYYMISRQNSNSECKVLGTGSYSVVWDFGNDAYKLTNEQSYEDAVKMLNSVNKLAKVGINVPNIRGIDTYRTTTNSLVTNLKHFVRNYQGKEYYKNLKTFAQGFKENVGKYGFLGIRQEKILGSNPFAESRKTTINSVNSTVNYIPDISSDTLHELNEQLSQNLDYFNSICSEHYLKFILDAAAIQKDELVIDNKLTSNFIYNPSRGFYFIDLDGLKNSKLQGCKHIFEPTIDNICECVFADTNKISKQVAKKQLELCIKLKKVLDEARLDKFVDSQYQKYYSGETLLKKMFNKAINIIDEKDAQVYYEVLKSSNETNQLQ